MNEGHSPTVSCECWDCRRVSEQPYSTWGCIRIGRWGWYPCGSCAASCWIIPKWGPVEEWTSTVVVAVCDRWLLYHACLVLRLLHGTNLYSKNSYLCDSLLVCLFWKCFIYIVPWVTTCVDEARQWTCGSECLLVVVIVLWLSFCCSWPLTITRAIPRYSTGPHSQFRLCKCVCVCLCIHVCMHAHQTCLPMYPCNDYMNTGCTTTYLRMLSPVISLFVHMYIVIDTAW